MKASLSSLGIPFGFLNLYCIYRDLLSPTIIPHIVFFSLNLASFCLVIFLKSLDSAVEVVQGGAGAACALIVADPPGEVMDSCIWEKW